MKTVWPFAAALLAVLALPAHAQDASTLDEARLKDGRVLRGRVVAQTPAGVVLCLPDGTTASVARAELYALVRSESPADAGVAGCAPPEPVVVAPPPEPSRPGQHLELRRPRIGVGAGGIAIALGGYLSLVAGLLLASSAFHGNGDYGATGNWLYVPLAGPIVAGALTDWSRQPTGLVVAFVVDELLQLGGMAMFSGYLLQPKKQLWVPDSADALGW